MKGKARFEVSKKELEKLYEFHSTADIGRMLGVSAEVVRRRLHKHGIQPRSTGPRRMPCPPREILDAEYQQHSMKQLSVKYGVGETTIWKWLQLHGIRLKGYEAHGHRGKLGGKFSAEARANMSRAKRGRWTGEKNPNWKGGVHQKNLRERASGAYKQWRIAALSRANHACEDCGVSQNTICECCGTKVRLHVHHLESFAKFPDKRYDPNNSEVLCPKCHHTRHNGKTA